MMKLLDLPSASVASGKAGTVQTPSPAGPSCRSADCAPSFDHLVQLPHVKGSSLPRAAQDSLFHTDRFGFGNAPFVAKDGALLFGREKTGPAEDDAERKKPPAFGVDTKKTLIEASETNWRHLKGEGSIVPSQLQFLAAIEASGRGVLHGGQTGPQNTIQASSGQSSSGYSSPGHVPLASEPSGAPVAGSPAERSPAERSPAERSPAARSLAGKQTERGRVSLNTRAARMDHVQERHDQAPPARHMRESLEYYRRAIASNRHAADPALKQ